MNRTGRGEPWEAAVVSAVGKSPSTFDADSRRTAAGSDRTTGARRRASRNA
jgi:hypothetical protein